MAIQISERRLREVCRATIGNWPEARAAILFGSRARGTARPDSDWDIAIVLDGEKPAHPRSAIGPDYPQAAALSEMEQVDPWTLSAHCLRRRACDLGALPHSICRDGRILAGHTLLPALETLTKEIAMQPDDWEDRMKSALGEVENAMSAFMRLADTRAGSMGTTYCNNLRRFSANAAELLVKAAMERRGVAADRTHRVNKLADEFARHRPEERILTARFRALDGVAHADHVAIYEGRDITADEVRHAYARLRGVLALWADEVLCGPDDDMLDKSLLLVAVAADTAQDWLDELDELAKPIVAKVGTPVTALQAALDGRYEITAEIAAFQARMLVKVDTTIDDGDKPAEDLSGPRRPRP